MGNACYAGLLRFCLLCFLQSFCSFSRITGATPSTFNGSTEAFQLCLRRAENLSLLFVPAVLHNSRTKLSAFWALDREATAYASQFKCLAEIRSHHMNTEFDLVDAQLFINISETNSLTRGANRSYLSVPAASIRIKNIEDRLGTKLLYRTSQGVTLTPAGQAFLHHGRLVLEQLERLRGDLQEYARGVRGHVRIFANTNAISEFLPAIMEKYLTSNPSINVDLREHLSPDIVRAVSDGTTDIGIIAGTVRTDGLEVFPFRNDSLVLVTALNHPLARREKVTFYETLDFNYIGLSDTSAIHSFLNQSAKDLHQTLKLRIQVSNFEALCRMIETNIGIGIMPASAAYRHSKTMAVQIVRLSDDWAVRDLKICVRSRKALPTFARDLIDLLISDGVSGSALAS